jgi:hypothetical protein
LSYDLATLEDFEKSGYAAIRKFSWNSKFKSSIVKKWHTKMQNQPEMRSKWRAAVRAWPRARGQAPPLPMLTKNSKTMVRIFKSKERDHKLPRNPEKISKQIKKNLNVKTF